MRAVRLDALEHRIEAFPASIDAIFARHKEELISGIKALMQEQMEAMAQRLYEAGVFYEMPQFSVETKSSNQDAAVFEEMPESGVGVVHLGLNAAVAGSCERLDDFCSIEKIANNGRDEAEQVPLPRGNLKSKEIMSIAKKVLLMVPIETRSMTLKVFDHQIHRVAGDYENLTAELELSTCCSLESIHIALASMVPDGMPKQFFKEGNIDDRMTNIQLNGLIKQPEQPLPPPEPPPPSYNDYKLPPSRALDISQVSGRNANKVVSSAASDSVALGPNVDVGNAYAISVNSTEEQTLL